MRQQVVGEGIVIIKVLKIDKCHPQGEVLLTTLLDGLVHANGICPKEPLRCLKF